MERTLFHSFHVVPECEIRNVRRERMARTRRDDLFVAVVSGRGAGEANPSPGRGWTDTEEKGREESRARHGESNCFINVV